MSIGKRTAISYRDPHGYVFEENSKYYRFVDGSYKEQYAQLINSGLYNQLVEQNLLLPFQETEAFANSNAYKILLPEQLEFISYPYEWGLEQWKECATAFLKINQYAIKHGMILKDATPLNFCLHKGNFIMFDVLSFEFYNDGDPWIAYRQFCECFLAPISLMKFNHPEWGKFFRSSIKGLELTFANKNLSIKSYLSLTCLLHIHWHSAIKNRNAAVHLTNKSYFKKEQLLQLWGSFLTTIQSWQGSLRDDSLWLDYYQDDIQTNEYMDLKLTIVDEWLKKIKPIKIIDIGANTGKFSVVAAKHANQVVAIESDYQSLNNLYKNCRSLANIYPVYADLSDPSPDLGWENGEAQSLLKRIQADAIMGLAVIHHLRITYNIPLLLIAKFFHKTTSKYLLIEFVAKSDNKVKTMLANRKDIFEDYTTKSFIEIFSAFFLLIDKKQLLNDDRILYLWERR